MTDSLLSGLSASPDIYLQKIDLTREAALLVQLNEGAYRAASFLDDRILTPGLKGGWVNIDRVLLAAQAVRDCKPLHFIFHTGHVGSTLLSRLLDESECVLSLREPLTLRTLADEHDVLGLPESLLSPRSYESLEDALLKFWSRGYQDTHAVVLKATSSACRIAGRSLERCTSARAVYLNLAPEPYLATLLAGPNSRIDLRGHGRVRIRQLQARIATPLPQLHALTPGELAAMSWLAETWNQHDTLARFSARVMTLDFDGLLADLQGEVSRVLAHFGLPIEPSLVTKLACAPVLTRYSKSPDLEYSPELRLEVLRHSRQNNRTQIAAGLRWLEELARSQPAAAQVLNTVGRPREPVPRP